MVTSYLPKPSYVRYDKIFTLNDSIIVKFYGTIGEAKLQEIVWHYIYCNRSRFTVENRTVTPATPVIWESMVTVATP
ncbi:hypothetical protein BuS5_03501 [Desulfosarcina sp. BuS5]|uniref:hypothetical protein n=1 Tax=Desulfosarcina sp. BuS5 TaxID=933262 RepID=UPI0012FC3476|nr:hypothetical protein [Desulfosarcina sp. BuS5]WDN90530.1 hypothetical protein BuS5_03501 [Desulfosarcina sp. BuS5]